MNESLSRDFVYQKSGSIAIISVFLDGEGRGLSTLSESGSAAIANTLYAIAALYIYATKKEPWFGVTDFAACTWCEISKESFNSSDRHTVNEFKRLLADTSKDELILAATNLATTLKNHSDLTYVNEMHKIVSAYAMELVELDGTTPKEIALELAHTITTAYHPYISG